MTESAGTMDSQETSGVNEYALPLSDSKSYTAREEKIAFVVSLWEARATIHKSRQLLIQSTQSCEPMLSADGKTLALRLDSVIRTYDSVYFEPLAEINVSK